MGAGNWLPGGRDGLIYWDGFYVDYEGIYNDFLEDESVYDNVEIDMFIETVIDEMTSRFPELYVSNEWRNSEERVYLEDENIKLVMGENQSSVAVYFILEEDFEYYKDGYTEEESLKFKNYVEGLKSLLLEYYPDCVYKRSSPWTSSKIKE